MPQFVRLVNNQDNARKIGNAFRDELILAPYSKVSLTDANLRFAVDVDVSAETYTVDNTIQYTIGGQTSTVVIDQDFNNRNDFLNGVRNELNFQYSGVRNLDWDYQLDDGKVTLQLTEVNQGDPDYNAGGDISGTWTSTTEDELLADGDQQAEYISDDFLTRANSYMVGQYQETDSDFTFGFAIDSDPNNGTKTVGGILIDGATKAASFVYDGTSLDLSYNVQNDDDIALGIQGGNVTVGIAADAVLEDIDLTAAPFNLSQEDVKGLRLQHYVANEGNGTGGANGGVYVVQVAEVRSNLIPANTATLNLDTGLGTYLGFDNRSITNSSKKGFPVTFIGDNRVAGDKTSQGILVNLEGAGRITSFDGASGSSTNTIAIIPQTANVTGTNDVVYSPTYKYKLELRNATPLRVNNLTARFRTRTDERDLPLRQGSVLALLFED